MKVNFSHTQVFAHDFSKRYFSYIQNSFKHILLLTNSILYSIPSLDQNYFEKFQDLQKYFQIIHFWPAAVDRAVDRLCFRSERSTDRSTGLLTVWVRACVHVSRSTGRSTGPHFDRPTFGRLKFLYSLFVLVNRAVDRGLATAKFFENPVDRPVDRELDFSLTATLFNTF